MPIYRADDPRLGLLRVREWRRAVVRTLALLGVTWALCIFGLMLVDTTSQTFADRLARAVWNAANLISTLGDFTSLTVIEKAFVVVTMFVFMMIGGYALSRLTGLLSSDDVLAHRENRKMERALNQLADHVIVVGFGPVGRQVAERLRKAGHAVLVIDRDEALAVEASELGYHSVRGDVGADDGVLSHARIDRARSLIVTTEEPDRKLSITLLAHASNPQLRIAATGANALRGTLLQRAGASQVVVADELIADALVSRVLAPADTPK